MRNYFLIALLLVVISGGMFAQFVHPKFYVVKNKQEKLEKLNGILKNNAQLIQLKDEKFSIYSSFSEDKIRAIKNSVPVFDSANVAISLLSLNNLISLSGLPLDTSYSIGSGRADGENVVQVPITFILDSIDYNVLLRFVENLQQWDRSVLIKSVSIREALNNPERSNSVRARITVSLLFLKNKSGLLNSGDKNIIN